MNISYYKLPLETSKITSNKELDKCSIMQSIVGFIHLITTSYFGECTFDESFGCSIWNVDFDNLTSTNKLRNTISESLVESIIYQEKRLKKVNVEVMIEQEEFQNRGKLNRIKKRVDIKVVGVVSQTNEPFSCVERFYIAPLSF
ncbi:GPW/gp25 family protein [Aquimarina sp. MMG016]|uniref:GPW/gp25 family protein n=1 Tax=Aquimarina sp. MMG016 TaxID=2822690 RepID=UPI001B3A7A69|nr:GPW/gp25 family protein [Aquimarina sp. MMG016]MBQ4821284.1 GPW/gp25 family protein [Aquimarina sp. MMG016]